MRLFIRKEPSFTKVRTEIVDYSFAMTGGTIAITPENWVRFNAEYGDDDRITIYNCIPGDIGRSITLSLTYIVNIAPENSHTFTIYHNDVEVGEITENNTDINFIKVNNDITIRYRTAVTHNPAEVDLTNIYINESKDNYYNTPELDILDSKKVSYNAQKKDFTEINATKSSYSNTIKLKFTPNNIEHFGYHTNLTDNNLIEFINGVKAFIATDNGNIYQEGKLTIKKIIKYNNNYVVEVVFTDDSIAFFSSLESTDKISLPDDKIVENTYNDKIDDLVYDDDYFEKNEKFWRYGFVINNYKLEDDDVKHEWTPNTGEMIIGYTSLKDNNTINIYENDLTSSPMTWGYSNYPQGAIPMVRYKELLKEVHDKYGFSMSGSILDDPRFYNLVLNTISTKNEEENEETKLIAWEGEITINHNIMQDHEQGTFLKPGWMSGETFISYQSDLSNINPLFNFVRRTNKQNIVPEYVINEDILADDMKEVAFGTETNNFDNAMQYVVEGINPKHDFYTKVKASVMVEWETIIASSNLDPIEFDLILSDNIYKDSTNGSLIMNPYSFYYSKTFDVHQKTTNPGTWSRGVFQHSFEMEKVHYDQLYTGSAYTIKANVRKHTGGLSPNGTNIKFNINIRFEKIYDGTKYKGAYLLSERKIDLTENDLVKDFITRFNLYPVVDVETNIIEYKTYNEYYFGLENNLISPIEHEFHIKNKMVAENKQVKYIYSGKHFRKSYNFISNTDIDNIDLTDYNVISPFGEYTFDTLFIGASEQEIELKIDTPFFSNQKCMTTFPYKDFKVGWLDNKIERDENGIRKENYSIVELIENPDDEFDVISKNNSLDGGKSDRFNNYAYDSALDDNFIGYMTNKGKKEIGDYDRVTRGNQNNIKVMSPFYQPFDEDLVNPSNDISINSANFGYREEDLVVHSLYDIYYSNQIEMLGNTKKHIIEVYLVLSELEISKIGLGTNIFYDGNNYIISKISNLIANVPSKFELIKINTNLRVSNALTISQSENTSNINYFYCDDYTYIHSDGLIEFVAPGGDTIVGMYTNMHVVGRKYKIRFDIRRGNFLPVRLSGYYRDGNKGDYVALDIDVLQSFETIEFEYIRTELPTGVEDKPFTRIFESLKIHAWNQTASFIIKNIEIIETI